MSKPRERWWGYARRIIRDYPALKRAHADLYAQSVVGLRQLPEDDQKDFDAVSRAIEETELMADGRRHIDLISLVYWSKRKLLLKDAATKLHISEQTAKLWHRDFVRLVGKHRGFKV